MLVPLQIVTNLDAFADCKICFTDAANARIFVPRKFVVLLVAFRACCMVLRAFVALAPPAVRGAIINRSFNVVQSIFTADVLIGSTRMPSKNKTPLTWTLSTKACQLEPAVGIACEMIMRSFVSVFHY
jgi:hypothetical protein